METVSRRPLDDHNRVAMTKLPPELMPSDSDFRDLWDLHPSERPTLTIHGRPVTLPRWQQAYGKDYRFSGGKSIARPVPQRLIRYVDWAQFAINPKLNALLLNWYDGKMGHYIGKHRDSVAGLVTGIPIVTISLGEKRIMRFRCRSEQAHVDIELEHGSVLTIPFETNLNWTHEITKSARACAYRISITLRAFE